MKRWLALRGDQDRGRSADGVEKNTETAAMWCNLLHYIFDVNEAIISADTVVAREEHGLMARFIAEEGILE